MSGIQYNIMQVWRDIVEAKKKNLLSGFASSQSVPEPDGRAIKHADRG